MTMMPTAMVSAMDQKTSWKGILRPEYHADSGRVNIKDSTKMGWTTSKVPKPSAITCRP